MTRNEAAIRTTANALPVARIVAGPFIARHTAVTPPEERTWLDASIVATLSGTDKADGILARHAGPTTFGGWLDQMADKAFVIPNQLALKGTGEMPAVHPYLKIARDLGVSGLRLWASSKGRDVSAGDLGKRKTAAEMLTLTIANSPLARDPDRIRAGASVATALSLASFFDYIISYTRPDGAQREQIATTRNSTARQVTSGPIDKLVTAIDERAPFITPDHLTELGKGLVLGAAALVVKNPDKTALPTAMYTVGSLFDALDGSLARKKGIAGDGNMNVKGMIKDVRADKIQEIITFGTLSFIARRRGNHVAADNYAVGAMSAVLPALFRSHAESKGLIVAEGGIGTRVGRGILGGVGMAFNSHRDTSDILSAVVATNNVMTAEDRRQVIRQGEDAPSYKGTDDTAKFKTEAKVRRRALVPLAAAGLATGALLLKRKG